MALTRLGGNQSINLATNTTGTLGVANGGTGLASGTSGQFLKFTGSTTVASAAVDAGISMAQVWRLSSSFTGDATPIASNLEAQDTDSAGSIGSSMTQSSGIFTFPSTGMYLVTARGEFFHDGASRYNQIIIEVTTNNSSYSEAAKTSAGFAIAESNYTYNNCSNQVIIDVTDTSNVKVRFSSSVSVNGVSTAGESSFNRTHFSFIRLGDT
tara:strand:+ start:987 stop:1619 length:633 start_codon:yes stop_codon:yes gene_type:complete